MEKNYDFKSIEKKMQDFWEKEETYKFLKDSEKEIYSIDTPPPTVSGSLHIGHIFSYTQAEIIARFKRMKGYNVFYPFGFDNNGLPTERLVEKENKIIAKNLPRREFIEICKKTSKKYVLEFKELWQSLGFSVDWSLQYETIDENVASISQKSFIELVKMNKAYMKDSPVLWCTQCQTSIAQAELNIAEKETRFNYITFMVEKQPLIVATTRPELLYGCVCLFVHPDDERYKHFIGKNATVPLYNYEIPIYKDESVSIIKGTGVVMCATFGDSTDLEWFQKHKLSYRKVITKDGRIDENVPFIAGLKVNKAREEIINLLSHEGLLIKDEIINHTIGIHERCGKEIEIIPSKQWYIDILSNKDKFLEISHEINWYPSYMKNRYINWVENLKWDWCISRQRYFGVPFPVWYCMNCGRAVFAEESDLPVNPLETNFNKTCSCGCNEFIPEDGVFDTWATSSISPLINRELGEVSELMPMSMRTQAHEIIRTWAFYTIVKSFYHTGKIPWKDIMICGFVLAKKGEKISKSKENTSLSLGALIEKNSADVIRYWAANSKLGSDTFFSEGDLKIPKRFITKLWNACKFSIFHLEDCDLNSEIFLPVDIWIVERSKETMLKAQMLLNEYEIGSSRQKIDDFFWKDFCDYYLEIVKERLYRPDIHGEKQRKSAQKALYISLLNILKLYAIYTPHITEYIYQEFFRKFENEVSLHNLFWKDHNEIDINIISFGDILKENISMIRKYKSENNLSLKSEMECIKIKCEDIYKSFFKQTENDIKACCNAKEVLYASFL